MTNGSTVFPWPVQVTFLGAPLVVGQGLAGLSVGLFGPPGGADTNILPPAFFGLAWICLYPTFAMASLHVLRTAPSLARATAIRFGAAFVVFSLAWMPIACAMGDPWVTVGLDLVASALLAVAALSYVRVAKTSASWLLPAALWMPITTALSLHAALTAAH